MEGWQRTVESQEDQPWRGEPDVLFPDDGTRLLVRQAIGEAILGHAVHGGLGLRPEELSEKVAKQIYDSSSKGDADYLVRTGDVALEISRLRGDKLRLGPDGRVHLFDRPS